MVRRVRFLNHPKELHSDFEALICMLKISLAATANHSVTLKLEGRIVGPWVEEMLRTCELHLKGNRSLKLELSDVSFADASGVATLRDLKTRGAVLVNCSPFVEEQLKRKQ